MASLLPDLDIRSVLDVVEENFERVQLKTYACRMMYTGEHSLPQQDLMELFQKSIKETNSGYCEVPVHGCLLVYDSYFIHIIEGSEDTIHRQLRNLFRHEKGYHLQDKKEDTPTEGSPRDAEKAPPPETKLFKRLKLLIVYHSITTRLFENWRSLAVKPPALVTKLDIYEPMPQHIEQLQICLDRLNKLCEMLYTAKDLNFDVVSATDHKAEALPEAGLLDFLLSSQYILDLRQCFHLHRRVDNYSFYFEEVWPLPTHFTPRLLYKLKIDDSFVEPLPVMPWEKVKKEKNEDDDREERSSRSSSD